MSPCPSYSFFIPGENCRLSPGSSLWHLPLSGNFSGFSKNVPALDFIRGPELTIGDYFTSARGFLENDHLRAGALSVMAGEASPIRAVELYLEKHGAFYHPLRVKVLFNSSHRTSFVLNGAVCSPGLSLIKKEYQLLACLEKYRSISYTPKVFAAGIQTLELWNPENSTLEKRDVGFFLGEWFEGFREFHISGFRGERQIAVWASNGQVDYLSLERASIIYEQIAYILTVYYNVDTGEQIFPWHHAAGDFVVDLFAEGLPVKLTTVRGYGALMEFDWEKMTPGEQLLPSLLFFFLNLTLGMQIDRLDGVGTLVFLGKIVLEATVKGFLRGLDDKTKRKSKEESREEFLTLKDIGGLRKIFVKFMAGFSRKQLEAILVNLIEAWPGNASERAVAAASLDAHSACIHSLFKNM
ncbi:MAG: hypothetical protein GY710_20685 [Desulfobacteraceae bacterium]|nr:hypothetical protein [Desulfobacteraceae bacterium]